MADVFELDQDLMDEVDESEGLKQIPEGEYRFRVTDILLDKEDQAIRMNTLGEPFVMVKLTVVDHEDSDKFEDLMHYLPLPSREIDDPKKKERVLYQFKEWKQAVGIEGNTIDPLEWASEKVEFYAIVEQDKKGQPRIRQITGN